MSPRLAEYVKARVPEARVERQWEAIERAGLPGPAPGRSRRPWGWAAAAVVTSALVFGASRSFAPAPSALQAGALVESAQGEVAVRLEDGSQVQLAPRSQLRLLANRQSAIELELRSGSARFDVTHRDARSFAVKAGPTEVRVVGTRFAIRRTQTTEGLEVRVTVTEGAVEVARRDVGEHEPQRIHAGESWSALILAEAKVTRDARPAETSDVAAPADEIAEPAPVEVAADPTEAAPPEVTARKAGRARARGPSGEPAIEVFRRGNLARRAGQMREAADAYAALLASYPDDARAGLAAFELGRIRMDAQGDEAGAIKALERSLAAGPGASFHEDALARIVVAQDALGRTDACRRARERYLSAYSSGVHAHALSARCK